ncbi:hypothetical protein IWQ61_005465 [Dispira simplex]|nr:hypothetical protein IWQ61_005465 [Dispira simplex]
MPLDIASRPRDQLSTDLVELRQRAQRQAERIHRKQELLAVVADHLTTMETCLHTKQNSLADMPWPSTPTRRHSHWYHPPVSLRITFMDG